MSLMKKPNSSHPINWFNIKTHLPNNDKLSTHLFNTRFLVVHLSVNLSLAFIRNLNFFLFLLKLFSLNLIVCSNLQQQQQQQQPSTYRLISSSTSFAQYPPWFPCLNGSLTFEFKTHEPNSLLFYAQSLPYRYIQLSLADGSLRMRMRIGEKDSPRGQFLVFQRVKLNDEKWHRVDVNRMNERTMLSVDDETIYYVHKDADLEGVDLYFGSQSNENEAGNSLFFGGLPNNLQTFDLSLGTALFEHRFNGFVRNVRAQNCSAKFPTRLNVISSNNLRYVSESDLCVSNPCLNNGVCAVQSESSYTCDCSFTSYEGKNCEKLKPPRSSQELTFSGKDYFSFEIPSGSSFATTYEEEFNLDFRTSRSSGLLAYAGDAQDYFVIGLQDGGLFFKLNIKGQSFERTLTIPGTFLHNNHWHSVKFARKVKQIEISIDNMRRDASNLTGEFIAMQTRVIYVGGAPRQNTIYRTIRKNFIGCVRNVTFKSDTVSLNLIDMALNESHFIHKVGNIQKSCQKIMDPVTFSSANTYIPIQYWKDFPKINSFSIDFQTTETYGVLAYILGPDNINNNNNNNKSARNSKTASSLLSLNRDFFSLEIHNRFLNAYFNLGSSYIRHEVVNEQVSSGKSHQLTVEINEKYAIFKFDQRPETSIRIDSSPGDKLELMGPLIIGGIYPPHISPPASSPSLRIPPYFYSGMLGHGYVGCIQDVEINAQFVNLTHYASLEGVSGINTEMCSPMPNQCEIGHCMNDGVCQEGWNRFVCDCSATGFNGPICNQPATIANFVDGQHLRIRFEPEWMSEAEHISLRFKTNKKQNCYLLSTYSPFSKDLMEVSLDNTQIKLYIRIGNSETTIYSVLENLNDNNWHTMKIFREGARIILQVDNEEPVTEARFASEENATRVDVFFHFSYLEVGTSIYTENKDEYFLNLTANKALAYVSIDVGSKQTQNRLRTAHYSHQQRQPNSFEGQMQQLLINGKSYFELIDNGDLLNSVNRTVTFLRSDLPHKYPLTFHGTHAWLALPKIDAFHILLIQFHFKTSEENGLILYNAGVASDYIAVELVDGQIHYVFSLGKVANVIRSKAREKLGDNRWHLVSIWRSTKTNHELSVDSLVYKYSSNNNEYTMFNLVGNLNVGGLRNSSELLALSQKAKISSKHGFKGCLASLEINGRVPEFDEILNDPSRSNQNVTKGCENPIGCQVSPCKNDGVCVEKWEENDRMCNCEYTSYTGQYCEQMSRGYFFDASKLTFEYKSPLLNYDDNLAFGFETKVADGLLFKSVSSRNNKTILIELMNGFIQGTFSDLHGINHLNIFKKYALNDKKYHVVKFYIVDYNSSMWVDGQLAKKEIVSDKLQISSKKYQPLSHSLESSIVSVQIAGSKDSLPEPEIKDHLPTKTTEQTTRNKKFSGNIYGLIYNQFPILNLISQNDQRVKITGRLVQIDNKTSFHETEQISNECEDANSIYYDTNLCSERKVLKIVDQDNNISNNDESEEDSQTSITKADNQIVDNQSLDSQVEDFENNLVDKKNMIPDSIELEPRTMNTQLNDAATLSTLPSLLEATVLSSDSDPAKLSTSLIVGIAIASFFVLLLFIFAIYKYRNRDEGTYTIDETKNCGPFAELDAPLNGSKSAKKNGKNRRNKTNGNKEWYV